MLKNKLRKRTVRCLIWGVVAAGVWAASVQAATRPLLIVTTLFPVYDFSRQVGKDLVQVQLLLPPGVEPHSFEPRPHDILAVRHADIFVYTGPAMEPWAASFLKSVARQELVVVDASSGIPLRSGSSENHDDEHGHGGVDPHVWLDMDNAAHMVDAIAEACIRKDPAHKAAYAANAQTYKKELADFDAEARRVLALRKLNTIMYGGHFAFGYFAARYGLAYQSPYAGFSPNAEPSPRTIARMVSELKKSGARYLFYQELLNPRVAEAISREAGVELLLLHGAHNVTRQEIAAHVTFLSLMRQNLANLAKGLECR